MTPTAYIVNIKAMLFKLSAICNDVCFDINFAANMPHEYISLDIFSYSFCSYNAFTAFNVLLGFKFVTQYIMSS